MWIWCSFWGFHHSNGGLGAWTRTRLPDVKPGGVRLLHFCALYSCSVPDSVLRCVQDFQRGAELVTDHR